MDRLTNVSTELGASSVVPSLPTEPVNPSFIEDQSGICPALQLMAKCCSISSSNSRTIGLIAAFMVSILAHFALCVKKISSLKHIFSLTADQQQIFSLLSSSHFPPSAIHIQISKQGQNFIQARSRKTMAVVCFNIWRGGLIHC